MPPDTSDGRQAPDAWPVLKRFLPYLWPADRPDLKRRILLCAIFVLVAKALQISMGWIYGRAVDAMAPDLKGAGAVAFALVMAYVAARFFGRAFENVRNFIFERVGQDAARKLAVSTFEHLHSLSMRFHLSRRTGQISKVIDRGTKSIDTMLYFLLFNVMPTIIELVVVLAIFWFEFSPWLTLATAVMVAIYIFTTRMITDWRNKLRAEMNHLDTLTVGRSVDSLLNYETVKYFGAERRETERYARTAGQYADAAVKSENSLQLLNLVQSFITNATMAGAMGFSVWGWSKGWFDVGDLVFVNTLLMQLFRPLDLLGMVYRTIRQGIIDVNDMFNLLDQEPDVSDRPDAPALSLGRGQVEFRDVHFGYGPDRPILKGVSFTVPAGGTLAIVGPTGAGKSTIGRLLFRFYDPQAGAVLIDGQDIRQVTQASLRAEIGVVPQDSVLFNDTIGYNIGYGHPGGPDAASKPQLEAASSGAAIDRFIETLPESYDTQVGERGLKLSGGEKQRVAIARTLLKNPSILLLDEATSALDSTTEAAIQQTLRDIAKTRTTLVIAHRLSTVTHADKIIVLEDGRVVEQGTHDALLAERGLYAQMWMRQAADQVEV